MKLPTIITFRSGDKGTSDLVSVQVERPENAETQQPNGEERVGLLGQNAKLYDTIPLPSAKSVKEEINVGKPIVPEHEGTHWGGIFLAFCSGVFFTLCSGTVKYLTGINPMELLVIRSTFQVCMMLPVAIYRRENIMGPHGSRLLLLAQGCVGGTTLALLFYAFRHLPLGDAATIIFSSPVFVMLMSHIFLREPCGFYRTIIVFLLVSGVVLISKPPFLFPSENQDHGYHITGYIAAILATLFTAINIVIMRKCKDVHWSVVVFQFSFWSLVISGALVFILGHYTLPKTHLEWGLVLMMSTFGMSGQVLVAKALTLEGAGRVAVTRSMDIVLAYVLQITIFGEVPSWESGLGAGFVMLTVIGMGVEDAVLKCFKTLP